MENGQTYRQREIKKSKELWTVKDTIETILSIALALMSTVLAGFMFALFNHLIK